MFLRNETTAWPVGCAKPVGLEDYQRLGSLMRMEYLGRPQQRADGESILDKEAPGKTVFHTVAWNDSGEALDATYLHMYMQLQRQQPTYGRIRSSLREGLTEAEIRAQYPEMAKELVDTLLADVRTAYDFDAFVEDFVCESSHDPIGGAAYTGGRRSDDHDKYKAH